MDTRERILTKDTTFEDFRKRLREWEPQLCALIRVLYRDADAVAQMDFLMALILGGAKKTQPYQSNYCRLTNASGGGAEPLPIRMLRIHEGRGVSPWRQNKQRFINGGIRENERLKKKDSADHLSMNKKMELIPVGKAEPTLEVFLNGDWLKLRYRTEDGAEKPLFYDGEGSCVFLEGKDGQSGEERARAGMKEEVERLLSEKMQEKALALLEAEGALPVKEAEAEAVEEEEERETRSRNYILYGPPGTGKTYSTAILAASLCGKDTGTLDYDGVMKAYRDLRAEGRIAFTTFHQSYGYEDFIEGIKPVLQTEDGAEAADDALGYRLEDGVFKAFCRRAGKEENEGKPHVFIIDEINRGNISKIFGELITLIEDTKRAGMQEAAEAILPYSKEPFSVPENVYLIGTMNTADRSIALMDTALRRRFSFLEMMPNADVLRSLGADRVEAEGLVLDVAAMLECINERITFLYDREHTIGHAFFTKLAKDASLEQLGRIFENDVLPLLQDYFYEDYEKIQLVLGDNAKSRAEYQFIQDSKVKAKEIFCGTVEIDLPEKKYTVNKGAFSRMESYLEIIGQKKADAPTTQEEAAEAENN